jgi:hypothetical protein
MQIKIRFQFYKIDNWDADDGFKIYMDTLEIAYIK